jgi:uncharacterized protein YyaL (SSP411 family)
VLELFQATGEARWLTWALRLQQVLDERFGDAAGGWFSTTGTDASVLVRMKEDYDGAEPSATSVSAGNLLLLAHLTGDDRAAREAGRAIASASAALTRMPRAVPMMLAVLSSFHAGFTQVVIAGPRERDDTRALQQVVADAYLPAGVVVPFDLTDNTTDDALVAALPWLEPLRMVDGLATAYVCRGFTCDRPVTDPALLRAMLAGDVLPG